MFFLWLLLMTATLAFAALFRYDLLLVLFIAEVILLILFILIPRYFARHLSFQMPQAVISRIGGRADITLTAVYSGKLPPPPLNIRMEAVYDIPAKPGRIRRREKFITSKFTEKYDLSDTAAREAKPYLRSGSEKMTEQIQRIPVRIPAETPHFGMVRCRVDGIHVCEYIGIFHKTLRPPLSTVIYVLPDIDASNAFSYYHEESRGEGRLPSGAQGSDEFRGIREFHEGDRLRTVAWNETARFGSLMTREYDRDALPSVRIPFSIPKTDALPAEWDEKTRDLADKTAAALRERRPVVIEEGSVRTNIENAKDLEKYFISLCERKYRGHAGISMSDSGAGS